MGAKTGANYMVKQLSTVGEREFYLVNPFFHVEEKRHCSSSQVIDTVSRERRDHLVSCLIGRFVGGIKVENSKAVGFRGEEERVNTLYTESRGDH